MLLIKNGRVIDPASKTDAALDVLLDGEKIKEVGPAGKIAAPPGAEVFDATALIVAPGFIDLHVHLREPGQESSETIETGTRAAARGGFTAVCCMPNTKPVNDNASVTRFILDRAKAGGSVRSRMKRSEEHTSELQSLTNLVCRLLLEKKKNTTNARPRGSATWQEPTQLPRTETHTVRARPAGTTGRPERRYSSVAKATCQTPRYRS